MTQNRTPDTGIAYDGGTYTGDLDAAGTPHGHGTLVRDGNSYTGDFANGKPHGYGEFTDADGYKYAGKHVNGEPNGAGVLTSPDGTTSVIDWTADPDTPTAVEKTLDAIDDLDADLDHAAIAITHATLLAAQRRRKK